MMVEIEKLERINDDYQIYLFTDGSVELLNDKKKIDDNGMINKHICLNIESTQRLKTILNKGKTIMPEDSPIIKTKFETFRTLVLEHESKSINLLQYDEDTNMVHQVWIPAKDRNRLAEIIKLEE